MDDLLNFKFDKPFLSQSQLVELFGSMSESALKRYMKDWLDGGRINGSLLHSLNGYTKIKLIRLTDMTMR